MKTFKKIISLAMSLVMSSAMCAALPIYTVAEETTSFEDYIKDVDTLLEAPLVAFSGNQAFVRFSLMTHVSGCVISADDMKWEVSGTADTSFNGGKLIKSLSYNNNLAEAYCIITANSPGTVTVSGTEIDAYRRSPINTIYWNLNVDEDGNFDGTVTHDKPTEAPEEETVPTEPVETDGRYESQYEISIESIPDKTVYRAGDELDLTGLTVDLVLYDRSGEQNVIYDDVSPLDYPDVFTVGTLLDTSKAGNYAVKINCTEEYQSFLPTYPVSFDLIVPTDVSGDVNNDGAFSVADVVMLQRWLLTMPITNTANWEVADFNGDGLIDVFDLCLMRSELFKESGASVTKKLTLDDVIRLSQKGAELTLDDLEGYEFEDVGSGLYIYEYYIGGGYYLTVTPNPYDKTIYRAALCYGRDKWIDIRTDDVQEFINSNTPLSESDQIPDGYIAVFHGGYDDLAKETYIYKIDNGAANHGFEYINAERSSFNVNHTEWVKITGQGEVMWTDDVFTAAKENDAYDYVTIPNDDKIYTIEEFMIMFLMD